MRADVHPVARDEHGERRADDALGPAHPWPQRGHHGDGHGGVRGGVGVAVRAGRVAVGVQTGDDRQRAGLARHPLED